MARKPSDAFKRKRPDAVLLDNSIPVMSGIEALRAIRQINPEAKVAMLTGYADSAIVQEARDTGASDFVLKPYTNQRLLAAIDRLVSW